MIVADHLAPLTGWHTKAIFVSPVHNEEEAASASVPECILMEIYFPSLLGFSNGIPFAFRREIQRNNVPDAE